MDKVQKTVFLDNKKVSKKDFSKIIMSVQNSSILKLRGGFLFQSCIKESNLYIGIIPSFMEGERGHHYDIKLEYSDQYKFSGNFNADGTLGMVFFPPDKIEFIGDDYKHNLRKAFVTTLKIFKDHGLSADIKFDWVTRRVIEEIQLFEPVPYKLGDIL